MAIIPALPHSFVNGTSADATQVNANFSQILSSVNSNAAANGVNNDITQLAALAAVPSVVTTAITAAILANSQAQYPIGALYLSTLATNPNTLLGFGTWAAYAAGKAVVGVGTFVDGNGTSKTFTAGATQGEYNHTLITGEMPSHSHTITDPGHAHNLLQYQSTGGGDSAANSTAVSSTVATTASAFTGISLGNTGGGGAHNNIQPSIGIYIWQRTA